MQIAIVIVNWNGGEENVACIQSVLDEGFDPQWIYFVDNDSRDGSREMVEQRFEGLVHIRNDSNLGYGHANNLAIAAALERGSEGVLLLNNDATLESGSLAQLIAALEADPKLGIVGPRVLYMEESPRIWAAGGKLTFRQNLSNLIGQGQADGPEWKRQFPVDYVVGAVMLVRREVFEAIGLIDGDFFAYHEDLDFCLRAGYAGYGSATVGTAAALHAASHSTGGGYSPRRKYMIGVNTIWFLRRHGTPSRWLRFFIFDVLSLPAVFIVGAFRGRALGALAKAKGLWDGARGRRVSAETVEAGASRLW